MPRKTTLIASILSTASDYYRAQGVRVSVPRDGCFEVFGSDFETCSGLLIPAAMSHPRVPVTDNETESATCSSCTLCIAADPKPGDVDLEFIDDQIDLQVYSDEGRIFVQISVL